MWFALLAFAVPIFSSFGQDPTPSKAQPDSFKWGPGGERGMGDRRGTGMQARDDGVGMPWRPNMGPRMGPRGMTPKMGGRRLGFGGEGRFNGRHDLGGGERFNGKHRFGGRDRFNGRHGSERGNRFSGGHEFGGEDHFNGIMMRSPLREYW
ncbi:unnamed protein product [Cylicocyclus nassatus]|uniref:Sp185/333 n=1 Tax=Cylicocyclus nassatus TaxID=53992 RepID=A0AA36DMK7_CYLNA|nr:unnamed protein product [Cylicocyclus nassatus]